MTESNRNDAAEDVDNMGGEGGVTGAAGAGTVTPQAEVSGNDPAGFGASSVGDEGGRGEEGGRNEPSGGVGDWDPANAGGGGGELY